MRIVGAFWAMSSCLSWISYGNGKKLCVLDPKNNKVGPCRAVFGVSVLRALGTSKAANRTLDFTIAGDMMEIRSKPVWWTWGGRRRPGSSRAAGC
jgi:hypothetical protein